MSVPRLAPRSRRWLTGAAMIGALALVVVLLMLWLMGVFSPKVRTDARPSAAARPIGAGRVVDVAERTRPLEETAVGTIQPVHRVEVASRLLARVVEVRAIAGQRVARGDALVRLDDTDLRARVGQAESASAQALAQLDQARAEEARLRAAYEKNAVAALDMDRAANALKAAEAGFARATQAHAEAESVLAFAVIASPIDGIVIDKRVNSGDTASPGQVVATLLDPARMQVVANVRESLSPRLRVGDAISVRVDALGHACTGVVSEIVPEAEGASRTFQVKVTGPCPEGVYTGMFARLSIPMGEERVVLIPVDAVRSVGQVDTVDVASGEGRLRRAVRLGRTFGAEVEVLAGLSPGERVVVDAPGGGR